MQHSKTILSKTLLLLIIGLVGLTATPPVAYAATITVDSTADTATAGDGLCTLREAIINSNTDSDATGGDCVAGSGIDTIAFAIGAVGSQQAITPTSGLPSIDDPAFIDGWSQGGAGYTGPPLIELDGSGIAARTAGLDIRSGSSIVRGLVINGFTYSGILLRQNDGNWLYGNYIGTDFSGMVAIPNSTDNVVGGVFITANTGTSHNNIIGTNGDGTNDAIEHNLISGNRFYGVQVQTSGNVIAGNLIGTDVNGTADLGNGSHGIVIYDGGQNNIIGTDGDGISDAIEGNLISGNNYFGVLVSHSDHTAIAGNIIGLDINGMADVGNSFSGISLVNSSNNRIGTNGDSVSDVLERNVISGNDDNGVWIDDEISDENVIAGNYIGVDVSGMAVVGNNATGVRVDYGDRNRIGTNSDGVNDALEGNIISGNGNNVNALQYNSGISLYTGGHNNIIAGNIIGSDVNGTQDLGNYGYGIFIQQNSNGVIGSDGNGWFDEVEGNLIFGNEYGIYEDSAGSLSINYTIAGNLIGTQADGISDLGNDEQGIRLTYGDAYIIRNNTIAHNGQDGVYLYREAISHTISANSIFANGDLGIELLPPSGVSDGVTANDTGDGDTGANMLQNFPVLTLAESTVLGQAQINGTLNSLPNTTYTLEFFYNSAADASGYGEGEVYFGSAIVTTDGGGNAAFNTAFNKTLPSNPNVTATAIDPNGNTSEFSQSLLGQGLLDNPVTGLAATCTPASCEITEGDSMQLNASISGGTGVSYAWKLGDGWVDSGTMVTHTYTIPGVYTATVTASNNNNDQSADVLVTVRPVGASSDSSVYLPIVIK